MSKGEATRERILDKAFLVAAREGFEGLTIGTLADELGMSKSGLFAHFGSKEELQVAVLDLATVTFSQQVMLEAFKAPRGLPRLERVFENWMAWSSNPRVPGGCIFFQATAELDDKAGRPRDALVDSQRALIEALARTVQLAIEEGHLSKHTDPLQVAFELESIMMGFNKYGRLLKDKKAADRARSAFARLVDSNRPSTR